jgi:hypothetical protein
MKAQLYTKLIIILLSIIGVSSVITPASASFGLDNTKAVIDTTTEQKTSSKVEQTSDTPNLLLTNEIKSAIEATAGQNITSKAKETTQTTVGEIAGASSDSQIKAETEEIKDLEIPSLSQPKNIITHEGKAEIKGEINQEEIKSQIAVDKEISVEKVATVDICLEVV